MDQEQSPSNIDRPFPSSIDRSGTYSLATILGIALAFIVVTAGIILFMTSGGFSSLRQDMAVATVPLVAAPHTEDALIPASSATDPVAASLDTLGTSDELADIEADLNATDLSSLSNIEQI